MVMNPAWAPRSGGERRHRSSLRTCVAGADLPLPGANGRDSWPGMVLVLPSPSVNSVAKEVPVRFGGFHCPCVNLVEPAVRWVAGRRPVLLSVKRPTGSRAASRDDQRLNNREPPSIC